MDQLASLRGGIVSHRCQDSTTNSITPTPSSSIRRAEPPGRPGPSCGRHLCACHIGPPPASPSRRLSAPASSPGSRASKSAAAIAAAATARTAPETRHSRAAEAGRVGARGPLRDGQDVVEAERRRIDRRFGRLALVPAGTTISTSLKRAAAWRNGSQSARVVPHIGSTATRAGRLRHERDGARQRHGIAGVDAHGHQPHGLACRAAGSRPACRRRPTRGACRLCSCRTACGPCPPGPRRSARPRRPGPGAAPPPAPCSRCPCRRGRWPRRRDRGRAARGGFLLWRQALGQRGAPSAVAAISAEEDGAQPHRSRLRGRAGRSCRGLGGQADRARQ